MSDPWNVEPLGKHCIVKARIGWRGLASSEYTDEGPFLIAGKHVRDGKVDWASCDHITDYRYRESMEIALEVGDVILTKDGTIGRVARIDHLPGKATLNGTMMLLRPGERLDYRYLFHVLRGTQFKRLIDDKVSGSSIPHIFQRDMVTLPVSLPRREHQQSIACVLDSLDTTISQTEAIIEKLKQVKHGLLHDLLTRGIEANGELRPPQSQAPHLYKDSPLGSIPKEWHVRQAEDVCEAVIDCKNRTPPETQSGYAVIRTPNVRAGRFVRSDLVFTDSGSYDIWTQRGKPRAGDVLITREAPVGEVCLLPTDIGPACLGQRMMMYRPAEEMLSSQFMLVALLSASVQKMLADLAGGSTVGHVRVGDIRTLLIQIPSLEEQSKITASYFSFERRLQVEETALIKLNAQKFGLMDDLLTGRVRVTPLLQETTP